ncbi:MAG: hypothetical protein IJV85_03825 [Clostridia bacterium]|nr:hypothetical protein [Clostridia bacterium]
MQGYEIYVFLLCLIVFVALTALFSVMVTLIVKQLIRMIRGGLEDEKIIAEWKEEQKKQGKKGSGIFEKIFSGVFFVALCTFFAFSLYVNISEKTTTDIPSLRVVYTGSMAEKHKENKYLYENGLDNQFDAFDIIVTHKLPDEMELELYDVVVYEVDDVLLVHRIVEIEEPNAAHPNERFFRLQGDAVETPDRFPVRYEQMKAIYRGKHVPFLGSLVTFLQSPAGYLCILLTVFGVFAMPAVEKKIEKEKLARLALLFGWNERKETPVAAKNLTVVPVEERKEQPVELSTETPSWIVVHRNISSAPISRSSRVVKYLSAEGKLGEEATLLREQLKGEKAEEQGRKPLKKK